MCFSIFFDVGTETHFDISAWADDNINSAAVVWLNIKSFCTKTTQHVCSIPGHGKVFGSYSNVIKHLFNFIICIFCVEVVGNSHIDPDTNFD